MLVDRMINKKREVDVCVEVAAAGRTLLIGIECLARKRKADLLWVEGMWAKHQCLPTDRVVLVSKAGFTRDAEVKARLYNMEAITPDSAISEDGPLAALLKHQVEIREVDYGSLVTVEGWMERQGNLQHVRLDINWILLEADGSRKGTVGDLVKSIAEHAQQNEMRNPVASARGNEEFLVYENDGLSDVFLREETDPPTLLPLRRIRFVREASLRVRPVPLTHGDLEGVGYTFGSGPVVDDDAFVVMTEGPNGSQMSVRLTDANGRVTDWAADREAQNLIPLSDDTSKS
jgi:hypothetical protein